jgi:hypothetical protein
VRAEVVQSQTFHQKIYHFPTFLIILPTFYDDLFVAVIDHLGAMTFQISDNHFFAQVWYPYTMFHSAMFTTSGAEDDKVGSNTEFRLLPFVRDRLLFIAPFVNNVLDHTIYFGLPILGFGLWTKIELQQYE